MKILIIDDEAAVLRMYGEKLKLEGCEVFTAQNSEEGLNSALENKPDLILLDIIMPNTNGLDLLKNFKQNEETKNIPVYLLTNLPEECSQDKATKLGAAGYYVKAECEPASLVKIIQNIKK